MYKMIVAVCAVVALSVSAFAGGACCPASKAKSAAKASDGCGDVFAKLNLTADQQAKVMALKAECDKEKCSDTSRAKYMKGLEGILTAEQIAQCKELCAKDNKAGCPMQVSAKQ